ncbi:hypothetical protein PVAP13_1NG107866 [Panicum virgatum]|uniref:Uncharacterized protein n=1 Tax=Panicum virgatum TaxID=38727 RepID=A0A8T0WPI4_PANVG|nr:hypothetical protein PVAP13_1NG107866 [Panicum virgatum]
MDYKIFHQLLVGPDRDRCGASKGRFQVGSGRDSPHLHLHSELLSSVTANYGHMRLPQLCTSCSTRDKLGSRRYQIEEISLEDASYCIFFFNFAGGRVLAPAVLLKSCEASALGGKICSSTVALGT